MKKKTMAALAAIPAAVSYAAAVKMFKYGFERNPKDEARNYWKGGEAEGVFADEMNKNIRWMRSQPLERVMIRSSDRLRLWARILEAENPRGVIILMHGYRSCALHDFSCVLQYYHNMGLTMILPDQRAHGASDGKYITFGIKEKDDCRLWAEYAARRYKGLPILLDGISMGASTVMLASGGKLPAAVSGIIADCGYSSPIEIYKHVLKNMMKIPPALVLPLAKKVAEHRAGVDLEDGNVARALVKNTRPLLIIHGEADDFVPTYMSDINAKGAKNCDLTVLKIAEAGHGMSYMVDRDLCERVLGEFLEKCLKYYDLRHKTTND